MMKKAKNVIQSLMIHGPIGFYLIGILLSRSKCESNYFSLGFSEVGTLALLGGLQYLDFLEQLKKNFEGVTQTSLSVRDAFVNVTHFILMMLIVITFSLIIIGSVNYSLYLSLIVLVLMGVVNLIMKLENSDYSFLWYYSVPAIFWIYVLLNGKKEILCPLS